MEALPGNEIIPGRNTSTTSLFQLFLQSVHCMRCLLKPKIKSDAKEMIPELYF